MLIKKIIFLFKLGFLKNQFHVCVRVSSVYLIGNLISEKQLAVQEFIRNMLCFDS